jgi:hypothetical protein
MNKIESKRLLDVASPAAKNLPPAGEPLLDRTPRAANDDQSSWHLVPFPDGWYAAC